MPIVALSVSAAGAVSARCAAIFIEVSPETALTPEVIEALSEKWFLSAVLFMRASTGAFRSSFGRGA